MTQDQFIKPVTPATKKPKAKAKKYKTSRIFFVLDMSGSMHNVWDDTIGGFNSFLEEQKAMKMPTTMTVVLFDNQYEVLYDNVPIEQVKPLTRNEYAPRGGTALYDAIGRTINFNRKAKKDEKTVFAILTDGQENGSHEFRHEQIKPMIEEMQNEHDWEVLFVGANIDAAVVGVGMGVRLAKTASFQANGKGVNDIMKTAAYASNVSRGMDYAWMGASAATAAYADVGGGLNMNTVYESVSKGIDETAKVDFLKSTIAKK